MKLLRVMTILILILAAFIWYTFPPAERRLDRLTTSDIACGGIENPCMVGTRTYNLLVPKGEGPFPAVVFFHGSFGSGAKIIRSPVIAEPLLRNGYALIAPSALDITYAGNRPSSGWIWEGQRGDRDDHRFVQDVVNDATSRFLIDGENLIVGGSSNGATFVWYLACAGVDSRLQHFAPVGGALVRDRPLSCATVQPDFAMLHTHGRNDTVVPVDGTQPTVTWHGWLGPEESLLMLTETANCAELEDHTPDQGVRSRRWYDCQSGAEFRLDITDNGHEIPSAWAETVMTWHNRTRSD